MKSWLTFLASTLCVSIALAEPPELSPNELRETTLTLVHEQLVAPLKKVGVKRSKFSRAAPVPVQRRVRVLDTTAQTDTHGKHFARFAIDVRHPSDLDENEIAAWKEDVILGCAYLENGEVFVQKKDAYFPAKSLLGASTKAQAEVCRPVPVDGAQLAHATR